MIKKVVLKNFMSHEDSVAEFGGSTIAVVGENGAGKSAFLEAIPYAYFGIGRETKQGMSRIKGDGSHRVEIWEDGDVIIKRGRKPGGAGFCEVRVAGDLVSKGTAADAWVINHLGMDGNTFMLTAFFGLSDSHSDTLLRVLPSARLESMQKLANVGPYKYMLRRAKEIYDKAEHDYDTEKARLEGAKSVLGDDKKLQDGLSAGNVLVIKADEALKRLKGRRHTLQIEEETYYAFVKEKERVGVERHGLRKIVDDLEQEKEALQDDVVSNTQDVADNKTEITIHTKKLEKIDVDKLSLRLVKIQQDSGASKSMLELKQSALHIPVAAAKCPLCLSPITQETIDAWDIAVEELTALIDKLYVAGEVCDISIAQAKGVKKKVEVLSRENKTIFENLKNADKRIKVLVREIVKRSSELKKKDDRFVFLVEKLGEAYQGLQQKIQDISAKIDVCQAQKHSAVGQMSQIKESLKRNKKSRNVIKETKKEMVRCRKAMAAANLLKNAWSRYGIPLQLLDLLNKKIESRASVVYQGFDNGRIEVREVEDRGKPGIQFYLVDRKGDRTFSQLSMGEKAMFFVAIRVAIAQIVAEGGSISVDYLVLDEIMGNLSPKRRDDLIRLINKVLRKIFPQLIIVSHTEMRDIFSQTIRVSSENDVSTLEVV